LKQRQDRTMLFLFCKSYITLLIPSSDL